MHENQHNEEQTFLTIKRKLIGLFFKLNFKSDITLWTLILINVITLITAIVEQQSMAYVLLIAWGQSYVIGIFGAIRISQVKEYAIEAATKDRKGYDPNKNKQTSAILFFIFYSFSHLIYLVFILVFHWFGEMEIPNFLEFAVIFLGFFAHHFYVYLKRKKAEKNILELPHLSKLVKEPMLRLLPVHLIVLVGVFTLIIGVPGIVTVIIFQIFKLFFDVLFHAYRRL
jgi:Family of unknown function (DUF6498)